LPFFTVFTPTHNRAHTLQRVYASLRAQTFHDFEWLIVDDGSSDNTSEMVKKWQDGAVFPIRYLYQQNGGKHAASNVGIREARGELLLILDSDDSCLPTTLERFRFHWESMSDEEKQRFSTVSALCMDTEGKVIGNEYPEAVVDAQSVWQQIKLRTSGDRFGVNRRHVLQDYPFPEIPGEKFITEGIVWNRVAQHFSARFINERLRICEYRPDGLSASSVKLRADSPIGARLYYRELSELSIPFVHKLKALINYIRFSFHGRLSFTLIVRESAAPLLTIVLAVPGYLLYRFDKRVL
jgi:glycosyltransferase involved in cell wall biosynthesis